AAARRTEASRHGVRFLPHPGQPTSADRPARDGNPPQPAAGETALAQTAQLRGDGVPVTFFGQDLSANPAGELPHLGANEMANDPELPPDDVIFEPDVPVIDGPEATHPDSGLGTPGKVSKRIPSAISGKRYRKRDLVRLDALRPTLTEF